MMCYALVAMCVYLNDAFMFVIMSLNLPLIVCSLSLGCDLVNLV